MNIKYIRNLKHINKKYRINKKKLYLIYFSTLLICISGILSMLSIL